MKKILLSLIFSSFMILPAFSLGVNIGISGTAAVVHATGEENENGEKVHKEATAIASYGSIFVEKTLGDRLAIGIDYVPSALSSETANNDRLDKTASATAASVVNSIKVDFEDLTTYYLTVNLTESFYVKLGMMEVDVITKESLGTGSTYGDTSMDGETYGIGYNNDFGNGAFLRLEGTYMDLGDASVTASNADNKVSIQGLEGARAKISIGKSF